ncbi:MAG: hypothetical protein U9N87_01865 [Planctomycetota bacterium]|nr:hypothetical protein [Planctomycetota bacterium]
MKKILFPTLFYTVLLFGEAAQADVVRIDFGTADSAVMDSFTAVTPDTTFGNGVTAGWLDTKGLKAVDRPRSRIPFPPDVYTNELRQDRVESRGPATLRVAVPRGKYRVWIMVGPGSGERADRPQIWDVAISNGKNRKTATGYGETRCRALTLDAVSTAEGFLDLSISTRSKWGLNAMVVVPLVDWPKMQESEIAKLEQIIHLLPDDVLTGSNVGRFGKIEWKHTPHVDDTPAPGYTEAEKNRGFVIYQKPWVANVWPNTVPRREEFDPTLEAFACPDEYEPLTFTIMPLSDFGNASVTVTDLLTEDGKTILASDISVRYVQYKWVRPNYNKFGTYYRAPDVLPRLDSPQPLKANENFRVWMTVHARPYTPAGSYRGKAVLAIDGRPAAELPIVFKVLPIKLQKDPTIIYSTYFRFRDGFIKNAPDDFSRRWWTRKIEQALASMFAHGYTSFLNSISATNVDGNWVANFDGLQNRLDMARRNGLCQDSKQPVVARFSDPLRELYGKYMNGKRILKHIRNIEMPPQAFFDDVTEMVRAFEAERKLRGLPELLYYPIDEPTRTTLESIDFSVATFKAIKKVPGARVYVTADPTEAAFAPMKPYVDVWCCNHPGLSPEQIRADLEQRNVVHWCYPNHVAGENDHTPVPGARLVYGFWLRRGGYKGLMPWIFEACSGDPENYLDTRVMDFFNHTDDDAGVLPVTLYESYREGIDDGRYCYTLRRYIEKARQLGHKAAADKAEADLNAILDSVDTQAVRKFLSQRSIYHTGWAESAFDSNRRTIAEHILRLQKLCGAG